MSIAQFTVADDVINDFNQLFHKDQQNQVIEKLIRQIISETKQQHSKRQQAFYSLTNRRILRPTVSQNEIEQVRDEVQCRVFLEKKPSNLKKRTLGLLEGKGHFELKDNFKMTDEELFLS